MPDERCASQRQPHSATQQNEWWRAHEWGPPGFITDRVTFPTGITLLTGLIVGWLVHRLRTSAEYSVERASEAERLRDELARRVDVLEAANRCARALGSSLEIDQAFGVFIRELRGLVAFERTAIVLVEGETAQTMATAGRGANTVFPPGTFERIAALLGENEDRTEFVRRAVEREIERRHMAAKRELRRRSHMTPIRSVIPTPSLSRTPYFERPRCLGRWLTGTERTTPPARNTSAGRNRCM